MNTNTRTPFPRVPDDVLATFSPEVADLERLGYMPARWAELPAPKLAMLLQHQAMVFGLTVDVARLPAMAGLYTLALATLPASERMRAVQQLGVQIERQRRSGMSEHALALKVFLDYDTDPAVVSTAALTAAQVGGSPDEPEVGRRVIYTFALGCKETFRQTAVLTGLMSLGDAAVYAWARDVWRQLSEDDRDSLVYAAGQLPMSSSAEFLLTWAEDALLGADENEMARAIGGLGHLARVASGEFEHPYGGRGVMDVVRRFPSWAYPDDEVMQVRRTWTVQEFGRTIMPRLERLASRESDPKVVPDVIRRWS